MKKTKMRSARGLVCVLAAGLVLSVLGTTAALAAEVWSDEFDAWCDPDPDHQPASKCITDPPTDSPNQTAFWAYYPLEGTCPVGYEMKSQLDSGYNWDGQGYCVTVEQSEPLIRHAHDLESWIVDLDGNLLEKTAVNGSGVILDQLDPSYVDPATIATTLKGEHMIRGAGGSAGNNVFYVEWYAEDDRAPVNWNMFNCFTQYTGYPDPPPVEDPGQKTSRRAPVLIRTDGTEHASFALGMFALIDPYPCDMNAGRWSTEYTPVAFDGLNWVPLEGLPNAQDGWNQFQYYIGTDYIEIRMRPQGGIWTKTRIERQYKGPFNQIAMGTPQGIDQDPARCERAEWDNSTTCVGGINRDAACTTDADCPPSIGTCAAGFCDGGTNHGNACDTDVDCPDYEECLWIPRSYIGEQQVNRPRLEELHLADGIFDFPGTVPGACCERDGTCVENKTETECQALDGEYKGGDTICAEVTCTGACCMNPDGSCQDGKTEEQCVDTLGGSYNGGGSTCAEVDCGGACCLPDATCEFKSPAGCIAVSGEFTFLGTVCDDVVCGGACCLWDATCQQTMTEADCDALSGHFQGLGIACDDVTCCPDPFADADTDGDVDQKDFGLFQVCYSGSGNAYEEGCGCFDRDETPDGDIDADDFAAFVACYSGPTVPANRACDD